MKNAKRILLSLSFLLLCFSGCSGLDELRSSQAFWNNQEHTSFTWNQTEYLQLSLEFSSDFYAILKPMDENSLYITDSDVPVLLSPIFGNCSDSWMNGEIVCCCNSWYAKADSYDTYNTKHELDHYCICMVDLQYDADSYMDTTSYILLDKDTSKILDNDYAPAIKKDIGLNYAADIYLCDESGLYGDFLYSLFYDEQGEFYFYGGLSDELQQFSSQAQNIFKQYISVDDFITTSAVIQEH